MRVICSTKGKNLLRVCCFVFAALFVCLSLVSRQSSHLVFDGASGWVWVWVWWMWMWMDVDVDVDVDMDVSVGVVVVGCEFAKLFAPC